MFDLWAADDAGFDVYQFRLYCHIARVGVCWKSVRTLAEDCGMSKSKAAESRTWLEERGYIEIGRDSRTGRLGYVAVDIAKCPPHGQTQQERPPHGQGVHHTDKVSTTRTELVHHTDIRNKQEDYNDKETTEGGDARARAKPAPTPEQQLLADMVNTLSVVTGMDAVMNWAVLSVFAAELLEAYTPGQVAAHYGIGQAPNGHWNWFAHDWRGRDKGELPGIRAIRETIKAAVSGYIPQPRAPASAGADRKLSNSEAAAMEYARLKQEWTSQ